jgi:hypothetical protein
MRPVEAVQAWPRSPCRSGAPRRSRRPHADAALSNGILERSSDRAGWNQASLNVSASPAFRQSAHKSEHSRPHRFLQRSAGPLTSSLRCRHRSWATSDLSGFSRRIPQSDAHVRAASLWRTGTIASPAAHRHTRRCAALEQRLHVVRRLVKRPGLLVDTPTPAGSCADDQCRHARG